MSALLVATCCLAGNWSTPGQVDPIVVFASYDDTSPYAARQGAGGEYSLAEGPWQSAASVPPNIEPPAATSVSPAASVEYSMPVAPTQADPADLPPQWSSSPAGGVPTQATVAPPGYLPPSLTVSSGGLPSSIATSSSCSTPVTTTVVAAPPGHSNHAPVSAITWNLPPTAAPLPNAVAYPASIAYRPVVTRPPAGTVTIGKGAFGQPKLYVTGQPVRNALRWLGP